MLPALSSRPTHHRRSTRILTATTFTEDLNTGDPCTGLSDQLCLRYSTKAECDTCPLSPGVLGTRKWMPRHQTLTMRHLGIGLRVEFPQGRELCAPTERCPRRPETLFLAG